MDCFELKKMTIGDEKVVDISAGVDEKVLKFSGGKQVKKGENLKLSDEKGREYFFEINRIIGGTYLVVSERGKKKRLGVMDAMKWAYLTITRRRL